MEPSSEPEEVQEPVIRLELSDLRTKAGGPFVVYVEKMPEEDLVAIMRTLPGDSPPPATKAEDEELERRVRIWLGWAPRLIQAASFLIRKDGTEVRPAFYFGEKMPGAVKGSFLSGRDRTLMMNAILKLSGWDKESSQPAAFHGGERGGGSGGAGAVGAGESERPDPVGSGA